MRPKQSERYAAWTAADLVNVSKMVGISHLKLYQKCGLFNGGAVRWVNKIVWNKRDPGYKQGVGKVKSMAAS